MDDLTLERRAGLPEALRVLLADYPRAGWPQDRNFDGLVRFWLDRHMMFRHLMAAMRDETEALIDGNRDPQAFAARLSQYGSRFVGELHGHHQIEDAHYFPVLAGRDARVEAGFGLLDADHNALDGHLDRFVAAANTVLGQRGDRARLMTAAGRFAEDLAGLEQLLERHLTDEEDLVVPVILKYGTAGLG